MRDRSKTTKEDMHGSWGRVFSSRSDCSNPATQFSFQAGGGTYSPILTTKHVSSMSDLVSPAANRKKKAEWRKRQALLRLQEKGYALRQFMPAHPCVHTTTHVDVNPTALALVYSAGACGGNRYYSESYDNAAVYAREMGWATNGDPGLYFKTFSSGSTSSPYREHDWFALMSQFNEACDSLIPSSMLLGETMFEHGIFIDALKYIANPSRAIKDFLSGVVKLGLKKKNLGTIARTLKGSSNAWLSYNFGVKPAIKDIVTTVTAHTVVQQRLWYLANGGGSYVPIRVRQKFSSDFSNPSLPTSYPTASPTTLRKHIVSKDSWATIGAWGKVRDDLDWKDTWTAYLQYFGINKVIGLAWELIPFSFVLDWFTNAQERINDLTRFRGDSPYSEIRNLTCSLVKETQSDILVIPGYNFNLGMPLVTPNSHFKIGSVRERSYSRYLTIPETSGVVDFSNLGLFQAIATGALLVQRALR